MQHQEPEYTELDFASFCLLLRTHDFHAPDGQSGFYWDQTYSTFGRFDQGGTGGGYTAEAVWAEVYSMAVDSGQTVLDLAQIRALKTGELLVLPLELVMGAQPVGNSAV